MSTSGCLDSDRFLDKLLEQRCTWEKACQTNFDELWSSIGQCVQEEHERISAARANCDYDRKQAKRCLDAADAWFAKCSADYEKYQAYLSECGEVYSCPGDEDETDSETGS